MSRPKGMGKVGKDKGYGYDKGYDKNYGKGYDDYSYKVQF